MNDSTSEDGEPTSLVEKTKNLYGKHRGKVIAAGTALGGIALAVLVVVARQAKEQSTTEDAEDTGSVADLAAEDERRKSPVKHPVVGHTRTLADGRVVPIAGYERGGSSDDEDEDEGPSQAAA
ncbi:hypothetical protein GCM10010371_60570 [Streptomyces subrutilus]|uniref:Uncharacterized protein n=1 Tax=Streptomyces subrutilus TaxID=36818 RepID=A0A5P2USM8_9ACTN|nr:hypothetical protein [Streptomyces subrutilus]QEU80601.1 hypothetical protein CP968_21965 [Streptomyces subrutilus]GGZ92667.1 hypothetical protein GCM10010371_60570 [Streptomyces subrutilus]